MENLRGGVGKKSIYKKLYIYPCFIERVVTYEKDFDRWTQRRDA